MRHFIPSILFLLVIFLSSCGPSDVELAQNKLDYALTLLDSNEYNKAKLVIDTLSEEFPEQTELINQGKKLLNRVELKEQLSSIAYFDSLLVLRQRDIDELKKHFVFKPGPGKGYVGTYVHKRQQVSNSYDRTYIKAVVDENGEFFITSKYHGKNYINHNAIRVYDQGIYAETKEVPEGVDNRKFDDGEEKWETINYKDEYDNGAAMFIVNNSDKRLKVMFKGKNPYYIVLESFDKDAVKHAYGLSQIIKEKLEIVKNIRASEERIKELEKNI